MLEQQCEVVAERVAVRKHPGGEIIRNCSDPEATLDAHKGSGYQPSSTTNRFWLRALISI